MAQPLLDHIVAGQKDGFRVALRLKIVITSRSFQYGNFGDCAELVDWQFLKPDLTGWLPWAVESAKASAAALDEKRRREIEAQTAAAKADAHAALETKRQALQANVVKYNQARADKGDADGQLRMGELCRDGDGVPKDEAKARAYFTKSAAQGNKDAARALERLDAAKP